MITPQIPMPQISESELEFSFVRSSGPGGQNVNKVNSKAVLRWNVLESGSLSEDARSRLIQRLGQQLTKEGDIVLTSDRNRDQGRNREDCLEKFRELIASCFRREKVRKATKPSRSRLVHRKEAKSRHSQKKNNRRSRPDHD